MWFARAVGEGINGSGHSPEKGRLPLIAASGDGQAFALSSRHRRRSLRSSCLLKALPGIGLQQRMEDRIDLIAIIADQDEIHARIQRPHRGFANAALAGKSRAHIEIVGYQHAVVVPFAAQ